GQTVDRDSAYERLSAKLAAPPVLDAPVPQPPPAPQQPPVYVPPSADIPPMPAPVQTAEPGLLDKMMENPAFTSAMRSAGTVIGREITRSIFGTGRRRRR
ncbi:MAG: helicase HerA-like domain-containing protein, partial [Mycobacterium sp.]